MLEEADGLNSRLVLLHSTGNQEAHMPHSHVYWFLLAPVFLGFFLYLHWEWREELFTTVRSKLFFGFLSMYGYLCSVIAWLVLRLDSLEVRPIVRLLLSVIESGFAVAGGVIIAAAITILINWIIAGVNWILARAYGAD